jgi:hypothetical protein
MSSCDASSRASFCRSPRGNRLTWPGFDDFKPQVPFTEPSRETRSDQPRFSRSAKRLDRDRSKPAARSRDPGGPRRGPAASCPIARLVVRHSLRSSREDLPQPLLIRAEQPIQSLERLREDSNITSSGSRDLTVVVPSPFDVTDVATLDQGIYEDAVVVADEQMQAHPTKPPHEVSESSNAAGGRRRECGDWIPRCDC